jgi:hypothetical protein
MEEAAARCIRPNRAQAARRKRGQPPCSKAAERKMPPQCERLGPQVSPSRRRCLRKVQLLRLRARACGRKWSSSRIRLTTCERGDNHRMFNAYEKAPHNRNSTLHRPWIAMKGSRFGCSAERRTRQGRQSGCKVLLLWTQAAYNPEARQRAEPAQRRTAACRSGADCEKATTWSK